MARGRAATAAGGRAPVVATTTLAPIVARSCISRRAAALGITPALALMASLAPTAIMMCVTVAWLITAPGIALAMLARILVRLVAALVCWLVSLAAFFLLRLGRLCSAVAAWLVRIDSFARAALRAGAAPPLALCTRREKRQTS